MSFRLNGERRGDARTHNHTEGRHGTLFRRTKTVPWVQLGAQRRLVVISGVTVSPQVREQPGDTRV